MADGLELNAGSGGATLATDDAGAAGHVQVVKLAVSADGSATPITADSGGLLVNLGANNDVTVTGTVTVDSHAVTNAGTFVTQVDGAALTALQLIDDTIKTDDAAFTAATDKITVIGGIVTADSVDSGDAGAFAMLANRQQKVTLYDSGGVELAVGGGTQYTEDAAAAANPVGNALNLVRDDARGGSLTTTDGDNVAARGTNAGELYVKHVDAIPITDNSGSLTVDGTVAVSSITTAVVPGTGATNLGKAEDAAHSSGDVGVMTLTVRQDTAAALGGTDADYQPLITDGSGRLHVNVGNTVTVGSHAVTNAGTFAVQVDGSALTALQVIDNPVLVDDAAFTPATSSVMMAGFQADEASTDSVDEGDAGAARMTLDRKVIVTPQPHSSGGLSIFRSLDLDESEEDVKTSAGCVYGCWVTNTATTTRWLKFYNATAANVTVGTTTPVITIGIPGNTSDDISGSLGPGGVGINFDTAICVAATTGVADADTGAPSANDVIVNIFYK